MNYILIRQCDITKLYEIVTFNITSSKSEENKQTVFRGNHYAAKLIYKAFLKANYQPVK